MPAQTDAETRSKAQAFDAQMAAQATDDRAARRIANLQRIARHGGPEGAQAKRVLAQDAAAAGQRSEADALAALPRFIEEAGGDARAYMKADMQRRVAAAAGSTHLPTTLDGANGDGAALMKGRMQAQARAKYGDAAVDSVAKGRADMRAQVAALGMKPLR